MVLVRPALAGSSRPAATPGSDPENLVIFFQMVVKMMLTWLVAFGAVLAVSVGDVS